MWQKKNTNVLRQPCPKLLPSSFNAWQFSFMLCDTFIFNTPQSIKDGVGRMKIRDDRSYQMCFTTPCHRLKLKEFLKITCTYASRILRLIMMVKFGWNFYFQSSHYILKNIIIKKDILYFNFEIINLHWWFWQSIMTDAKCSGNRSMTNNPSFGYNSCTSFLLLTTKLT